MISDSRKNWVKVTKEIEKQVYKLIKQENDTKKKKKRAAKWYRDEVARILKIQDSNNPSLRSYEGIILKAKEYYKQPHPLDEPWHIGTIRAHPISSNFLPIALNFNRQWQQQTNKSLTIREILWMDKLRYLPVNKQMEVVWINQHQLDPNNEDDSKLVIKHSNTLIRVASTYAEFERWGLDTRMFDAKYLEDIWQKMSDYMDNLERNGEVNGKS